jgi:PAS domain S-box-containing protein
VGKCPITDLKQNVALSELELIKANGERVPVLKSVVPIMYNGNNYLIESFVDIIKQKRAEEALQQSLNLIGRAKREWESTADSIPQLICLIDDQGHILRTNRTVERWNLWQVVNVKGRRIHELFHPDCTDPDCYLETFWSRAWEELIHGQFSECEVEDRVMGRYLHIQVRPILPKIYREGEETSSYAVVVVHDITECKRAEKEIAALEEQLRQARKMEAIGRLAGGIAHDFNNLLTPIVGYSQLAISTLHPSDPMRQDIQEIQKSAERAAKLIRQMMTFSRRQALKPQVLNLNSVLLDMDKMLRQLIEENIELVTLSAPDLGSVKMDPGQFEQVLVNLVVNARDAMPNGGKLILETSNVTLDQDFVYQHGRMIPGRYVRMTVSDTGIGMSEEVKTHLFEPFFTTKEHNKGTGLGLSTVYGIVKQSNGYILVYSEPDRGTTFKIYFPLVEEEASALPRRDEIGYLPKGNETVLLVEDEPLVRGLAVRILREQGYKVLEASNGNEALRIAQGNAGKGIHLLLTDVVMPQMGGKELADRLKALRPGIKVLFTSGYTDNAVVQHGLLDPDIAFLEKPLSPSALARKVRELLDR